MKANSTQQIRISRSELMPGRTAEAVQAGCQQLFVLSEFPALYEQSGWRALKRHGNETVLTIDLAINKSDAL